MIEFDAGQNGYRLGARIGASPIGSDYAGDDVLQHRGLAKWLNDLKGSTDAQPGQAMGRLTGDIEAIEHNRSSGGTNKDGDGFKNRRLAVPVRPDQANDFVTA